MKKLPVTYMARLVTLCGCTRDIGVHVPMPPEIRVSLMSTPGPMLQMDDATLMELFADEPITRTFVRLGIERSSPSVVVGVYHERSEPFARRT